jgi:hypothetical protein
MTSKDGTKKISALCSETALNISEFIRGELPDSEMERVSNHISRCPECQEMLKHERFFEESLLSATEEELELQNIDEAKLEILDIKIMGIISETPQERAKDKLEIVEPTETTPEIKKVVKSNFNFTFSKQGIAVAASITFTILLIIGLNNFSDVFKSAGRSGYSQLTGKTFVKTLKKFNKKRSVATLYGYNTVNQYNGFLNGLAGNIDSYNPELQKTILHKIEKIELSQSRKKKGNKLSLTKSY